MHEALGREEEGTVIGDIQAILCECIFYNFYGEICGIPKNFHRFLKSYVHMPDEQNLGLASLY